ncbi:CHC2 zinc finger domain-containing protein [Cytobacillus sp. FJAT-54145]|uniref:CHC2 zinc finger domain-containing protein n=1 Tax=Cytobacillus spartinae TaxID=3299023 RepID=A0ABW6KI99_9BACI
MANYYPPKLIDELMQKIPFETVLTFYGFPVKGFGKSRGSNCPKCGKDQEHFKINTHRNVARCFVCDWSGNPIQFIQLLDNVPFLEAVSKFAQIGKVELPQGQSKEISRKEKMLYHAAKYYSQFESNYLVNRGISESVIKENMIGFAKGGKGLKHHLNDLSFSDEELLEVGLIRKRKNNNLMDYFFDCVIIPIFHNGRVIDLYGRYVKDGKLKHLYLFGDFFIYNLDNCKPSSPLLIVESKINALTILTHNNKNVVAIGGTEKFSLRHARVLKSKGYKKIYIGYDTGDLSEGGQKGAIHTGYLLEEVGIEAYILQMPTSTDINDLYCHHDNSHEEMKKIVREAKPFKEYEACFILDSMSISWIQNYVYERLSR